jgi:serine phosphatase RsbU (regulator of sigma subunit)
MSPGSSDLLTLPPEADSARSARRFVRRQLTAWGCEELIDAALLCVSELVTNAVIHTRTPLTLALRWTPPRLRVELRDQSCAAAIGARTLAAVGAQAEFEPVSHATSGRGLLIVAATAAAVGETIEDDGKTVWFELDAGRPPGAGPAVIIQQHVGGAAISGGNGSNGHGHPAGGAGGVGSDQTLGTTTVRLVDVPVGVAVASDDHLSDLVRELTLDRRAPLAERLVGALVDVGGCFPYDVEWRERLRAARVFGNSRLDVKLVVDVDRLSRLRRVADLLDEAEDAMRAGVLLTLPPPAAVRRFRRWTLEEIAAQLAGADPSPPPALVARSGAGPAAATGGDAGDEAFVDLGDPVHMIARLRQERAVIDTLYQAARRELEARKQLLEERAHIASTLQASLLPPELPAIPGLAVAGCYRPGAADVGGDFYDVFPLRDRYWGFILGDVCGKGPAAAAKTAMARYTLRTAAMLEHPPAEVLGVLNAALLERGEPESFCSAVFIRLQPGETGAAGELVVAGHPRPLVRRASGEVERLETGGALLGILDGDVSLRVPLSLRTGDVLLIYTDGVTEARRRGELFGEDRLVQVLAGAGRSVTEVARAVEDAVHDFADHDRADDVALLAISPTG